MLTCNRCNKAGATQEDIQGQCVDNQTIGCPPPREVIPGKDIVLTCREESCGRAFAFPVHNIVHHTVPQDVSCPRSPCQILVVASTQQQQAPKSNGKKKQPQ